MLYWRYGRYNFPAGAVEFTAGGERMYTTRGEAWAIRKKVELTVHLQSDSPAGLTFLINELDSNLVPGFDLGLYEQGGRPTRHLWRNSDTIGGVRVVSDGFPVGDGTEYTTYVTVKVSFEADFPVRDIDPLLSYSETVSIIGDGGPEFIYLPTLRGKWQKQQISDTSLVTATQSGEVIGWQRYPDLPRQIWPQFEITSQRNIVRTNPESLGGDFGQYKIAYSYSYESNEPLFGVPRPV
ncbi:MAG: hypothetical protein JSS49_30105 [Planctomycetes bacterium]|nr:hypothetical protein [Planctomycetota bacterium]